MNLQGAASVGNATTLSTPDLARHHYQERIAADLVFRRSGPTWASIGIDDGYVRDLRAVLAGRMTDLEVEQVLGDTIDRYRLRGNIIAEPRTAEWREKAQTIAGAELHALERMSERDDGADPNEQIHPAHLLPLPVQELENTIEPLSLIGLLEDHLRALERQGRGRGGRRAYPPVFKDLLSFIQTHRGLRGRTVRQADDARRLTSQELTAWRDEKLATLAAKTVKNKHIAAVKAVFQRAVEDHKLENNPALLVKVRAAAPRRTREKGYTDDEAIVVLNAALAYEPIIRDNAKTTESAKLSAAKRWGPWLCALTGARVVEIMQLRRIDILLDGGIDYIRITPDAGSVKSGLYRDVPLHPQLVELGFLDFVARSTSEYLFCTPSDDPNKRPAEVPAGRLSTWLREAKLTPPGVQPSHAWRHRFKSQSIDLDLSQRVVDAIQGHSGRTASDGYGDVSLRAKHAAILRLPHYDVTACQKASQAQSPA